MAFIFAIFKDRTFTSLFIDLKDIYIVYNELISRLKRILKNKFRNATLLSFDLNALISSKRKKSTCKMWYFGGKAMYFFIQTFCSQPEKNFETGVGRRIQIHRLKVNFVRFALRRFISENQRPPIRLKSG